MDHNLELRTATENDARFFWELVNDPLVREVSFDSDIIPWDVHKNWFIKRLSEKSTRLFVVETQSGNKVGQLRFEKKSEGYVISVSLVREFRGKGLGSEIIKLGSEQLFKEFPDVEKINAYIKHDNKASVHAFSKAGYVNSGYGTINEEDDAILMVKTK
jgi:RimJ/RimL family protein N-acetyltransferase